MWILPASLLLAAVLALPVVSGVGPTDRTTWWLLVAPVQIGAALVVPTWSRNLRQVEAIAAERGATSS